MKRLKMLILIGLFFVGFSGCSTTPLMNSVMHVDPFDKPLLSAEDHRSYAQMLEQDLQRLEEQTARIDQKVAGFDQKPYLDPKRVRRDGLKILRGANLNKIETLQEKVAWHRAQASRLASLDSLREKQSLSSVSKSVAWTGNQG